MARRSPRAEAARTTAPDSDKDWICLAIIGAPKGVRGALKLTCFTEEPDNVVAYGPLSAGPGGPPLALRLVERLKCNQVVVKIEGVDDRDTAAALTGTELYLKRADLPAPEDEEEFYFHDLIGLDVRHVDGRGLGTVKAVQDYGAGIFLEVLPEGAMRTFLLPFTRDAVPEIRLEEGWLTADPPEGTLDDV
jgi:16S rRNA processing protein RimM